MISAIPVYEEIFKLSINNSVHRNKILPVLQIFVDKVKSLMTHMDPEYSISGVNDPFLVISLLRALTNCLNIAKQKNVELNPSLHENIEKLIVYSIGLYKPNKKTVNSVLYEIA